MKAVISIILILFTALIFYSCAGYQTNTSTTIGFGINSGPYGYGSWGYPTVRTGVYHGGYYP